MVAWIVGHIPPAALLFGLVVIIAGAAMLLANWVRRRFPALTSEEHNDVTKFTYTFIGFIYAFLIGFIASSMWGQISTTDANARAEGAVAIEMARDLDSFGKPDSDRIRQSLLAYEKAAIAEWENSPDTRSPAADAALAQLAESYHQVNATTDNQKSLLAKADANLDKISQARTIRLFTAREDTGPPWPLWAIIYMTSAMVLGTVVIYGVEKPGMHYPMVGVVGVIVATNLFIIFEASHPFLGGISTTPDPLYQVVAYLDQPAR
ncbi:bestrophin-like domain [Mycolicibacterium sp. Dal123E01]|uniref:bestrophin-like domain n=1 Tax=Mycolicibacterium sp. Dal123E01 TaxID=3457578 RepID=UPI00403ED9F4